ncbi:anthrone oxygenase family protein [Halovulum sp. GXIMD14793]
MRDSPELRYWLLSAACVFVVAVLTFAFFVSTNTAFASGTMDEASGAAKLNQWLTIHYFRIGFGFAAAIFGCIALK